MKTNVVIKYYFKRYVSFVATAPIFIVKLPREKTIKTGATLVFNCVVEKTKLQECLVGVDIIAKG